VLHKMFLREKSYVVPQARSMKRFRGCWGFSHERRYYGHTESHTSTQIHAEPLLSQSVVQKHLGKWRAGTSKSSALEVCYWFLPLRPLSLANWGYRKRCTANLKTATLLKLAAQLSG